MTDKGNGYNSGRSIKGLTRAVSTAGGLCLAIILAVGPAHAAEALCTPKTAAQLAFDVNSVPAAYRAHLMRPDMMAVGDSLFNGVTSLTISGFRAEHSAPATVARALSLNFVSPNYRQAVAFDLEDELLKAPAVLLATLAGDVQKNIIAWQRSYGTTPRTDIPYFDNVAIAGASSDQLLCDTSGAHASWVARDSKDAWTNLKNVGTWFFDINTSFVLNPDQMPQLSNFSQMDWVRIRKPTRLLINIGSNDGVWKMAFNGYLDQPYKDNNGRMTTIATEMRELITNMKSIASLVPLETKYVYVDGLVLPGKVANLEPKKGTKRIIKCAISLMGGGTVTRLYYPDYLPYISTSKLVHVSGADVCRMDQMVNKENVAIFAAMSAVLGTRLVFVDLDNILSVYDRKDDPVSARTLDVRWGSDVRKLDNTVVHYMPQNRIPTNPWVHSGGVAGYDNMHPTMPSYALIALNIVKAIEAKELIPAGTVKAIAPQDVVDQMHSQCLPTAVNMTAAADRTLALVHAGMSLFGTATTVSALSALPDKEIAAEIALLSDDAIGEKYVSSCAVLPMLGASEPIGAKDPIVDNVCRQAVLNAERRPRLQSTAADEAARRHC